MASYYRIQSGIKYAADLLQQAEQLVAGRGDGRISEADALVLVGAAQDGPGITRTEQRTLQYIHDHFSCTEAARELLEGLFTEGIPYVDHTVLIRRILAEYQVERLQVQRMTEEEIQQQEALQADQPDFAEALRAFFELVFDPSLEKESPLEIVRNVHEIPSGTSEEAIATATAKLREYLATAILWLVPHGIAPDPAADVEFEPAENRESTTDHWVFYLSMEELSDHRYWGIIPRSGQPPYLYGFN